MVTVPSSVTSEPIARGCHSPFLGNAMMDHPCPWHLPQQHCSPSTCLWGYHNATVHSIFHLLSCAQHQCFMPVTEVLSVSSQGPTRFLWPWYTSPGTYGKRVHITSCTSLGGCRIKFHRLFPCASIAGQPSGLPQFLLWHIEKLPDSLPPKDNPRDVKRPPKVVSLVICLTAGNSVQTGLKYLFSCL